MQIELDYTLTPEDLTEWSLAHQRLRQGNAPWRWFRGPRKWVGLFIWAVALFVVFHDSGDQAAATVPASQPINAQYVVMAIIPYVMLVIIVLYFFVFKKRITKALARRSLAGSHAELPRHATVTDESIALEAATFSGEFKWSHFVHFGETANLFLLYESKRGAQIVPKRAFGSEAEVNAFRAMMKERIKPAI